MVMAGCEPEYAPVVRAALLAITDRAFNINGVQATTHMASPLVIVNGPIAGEIGMNGRGNAFGSGNRANATIGRAIRLVLLNVGGGHPPDFDKSTLGNPAKYTYCVCENEADSPFAPYHVEKGYSASDSTVFAMAAEAPHNVTDHLCNDPEGILDTICSVMSTVGHNTAVIGGHCAVVLGLEHAYTIASKGWTRDDVRRYLWMYSGNPSTRLAPTSTAGLQSNHPSGTSAIRQSHSIVPGPENVASLSSERLGVSRRSSAGHRSVRGRPPVFPATTSGPTRICDDGSCVVKKSQRYRS